MPRRSLIIVIALLLVSAAGYGAIGYAIPRPQFVLFISTYAVLFAAYIVGIKYIKRAQFLWALAAAFCFRLVLVPAVPALSDDVYRFIWDGALWSNGINPFAFTPTELLQQGLPEFLPQWLYEALNSPDYYSVYPPVNQFLFGGSTALFGTQPLPNVMALKSIILLAEAGSCWLIIKLLQHFKLPKQAVLWYALNPLIIIECTGNMHLEAVMIFFLLAAWYSYIKKWHWVAIAFFVLAVNTKLLPIILLPYVAFSLPIKRTAALVGALIGGTLLLHAPFFDAAFLAHFTDSLGLYFQSFEFNASIYYVVRWLGYQVEGYNIIQTAAPRLALAAMLIMTAISWWRRHPQLSNAARAYTMLMIVYLLFSTTVHPWYITPLVALAPLSGLRTPIGWSAVIPLSYAAYRTPAYTENLWLVAVEYFAVAAVIGYEIWHQNKSDAGIYSYMPTSVKSTKPN